MTEPKSLPMKHGFSPMPMSPFSLLCHEDSTKATHYCHPGRLRRLRTGAQHRAVHPKCACMWLILSLGCSVTAPPPVTRGGGTSWIERFHLKSTASRRDSSFSYRIREVRFHPLLPLNVTSQTKKKLLFPDLWKVKGWRSTTGNIN